MEVKDTQLEHYQTTFPSDDFLEMYFGKNVPLTLHVHPSLAYRMSTQKTALFRELRHIIDYSLRSVPYYGLRSMVDKNDVIVPKFTFMFEEGLLGRFPAARLDKKGLGEIIHSKEAQERLCREFLEQYFQGLLSERDWYQWKIVGSSVWVETIPKQIADGKLYRTLEETRQET